MPPKPKIQDSAKIEGNRSMLKGSLNRNLAKVNTSKERKTEKPDPDIINEGKAPSIPRYQAGGSRIQKNLDKISMPSKLFASSYSQAQAASKRPSQNTTGKIFLSFAHIL